jgi:hypothetical protein
MELYNALTGYLDGTIDSQTINRGWGDDLRITIDNSNRKKSLIVFTFEPDTYYSFFTARDSENYNSHLLDIALNRSYYHGTVFYEEYTALADLKEGYILEYFNEESSELLKKILFYVKPGMKFTRVSELEYQTKIDIANTLLSLYGDDMEDIASHYASYFDDALVEGMRQYVRGKLCNKFQEYFIYEKTCSVKYFSTVGNIVSLWDKMGVDKKSDINGFFKTLVSENGLEFDEDLYDEYYSYNDNSNFDEDGFNRDVTRILERILDKLEDDIDEKTMKENIKIINFFSKNDIDFNKVTQFADSKFFSKKSIRKYFIIKKIDDGKIVLTDHNQYDIETMVMNLEDFKNYYLHPELF